MTTLRASRNANMDSRLLRYGKLSFAGAIPLALLTGLALLLAGCASPPPRHAIARITQPPASVVSTQVYFYPKAGQSAEQQDRDRFECHNWAVKKTGFDPGQPGVVPRERVEVVPDPSLGTNTAIGAATGAVIGAAVSRRHETLEGAVVGAVAGGLIGAVADASQQAQTQAHFERRQDIQSNAHAEQQAQNFRNAMSACLEGRGYSVR